MEINELVSLFENFSQTVIDPQFEQHTSLYSKGGWEGWAQVEAAKYFMNKGIPVDRELNVDGKRIDLLINKEWFVELKCHSIENSQNLIPGVIKDMIKLQGTNQPRNPKAVIFWTLGDIGDVNGNIQAILNKTPANITYNFIEFRLKGGWAKLHVYALS